MSMRVHVLLLATICLLIAAATVLVAVPNCSAQQSNLKVTVDESGWTSGMKQNLITTPERGLVLKFTITNTGDQPLSLEYLSISIVVKNTEMIQSGNQQIEPTVFTKDVSFNSLYLSPKESTYNSVQVTINSYYGTTYSIGSNLTIGSYTATLTYTTTSPNQYGGNIAVPTPIEPVPLNFRVASESEMQTILSQNKGGTTIVFSPQIQFDLISGGVSITLIAATVGYLVRRKRKQH